jgi:hypothetical protein
LCSLRSFAAKSFRAWHSAFRLPAVNRLRELQEQIAAEKGIRADTLRRLLGKVDEYSDSHRAFGLPGELLAILKDDFLEEHEIVAGN